MESLGNQVWIAVCGGILFSLGLVAVVMLSGWLWIWSSEPSKDELYAKLKTYLLGLSAYDAERAIKAMMEQTKKWKEGGHIAHVARAKFLEACTEALLKIYKNTEGAIEQYITALTNLLDGLEALVWLNLYLELINTLFTMNAPGSLELIKAFAKMRDLKKIVALIEEIEKLNSVKDKAEKAKKIQELQKALDEIKGQIPGASSDVSQRPDGTSAVPIGDTSLLAAAFRGLFTSPVTTLRGCSPIVLIFSLSGVLGVILLLVYVFFGGLRGGSQTAGPVVDPDADAAVVAQADAPTAAPTDTPVPTATMSPIDLILKYGNFTEEQKAQILLAYLLDPEADWVYSQSNVIIQAFEQLGDITEPTDIRGHLGTVLDMSQGAVDTFFNNSDFPCASEIPGGFVLCTDDAGPIPPGKVYMFVMKLGGEVPKADPDHYFTYAVVVDADGVPVNNFQFQWPYDWDYFQNTDRWYSLDWDPQSNDWFFSVTDVVTQQWFAPSDARAVLMGDTVIFFVPGAEITADEPGYRLTAFGHDGNFSVDASIGDVTGADPTEGLTPIPLTAVTIE